tara:strand:- start:77 stop:226 length:150 start_codon:yes stop_codon:yes gene_type:complete
MKLQDLMLLIQLEDQDLLTVIILDQLEQIMKVTEEMEVEVILVVMVVQE